MIIPNMMGGQYSNVMCVVSSEEIKALLQNKIDHLHNAITNLEKYRHTTKQIIQRCISELEAYAFARDHLLSGAQQMTLTEVISLHDVVILPDLEESIIGPMIPFPVPGTSGRSD